MDLGARGKQTWRNCPADIKEEMSFFLDHGYVVLRKSIGANYVLAAKAQFAAHKEKFRHKYIRHQDANGYQRRLVNLHMALDGLKDLFTRNERALRIQDYLFQEQSACFTSLTFESGSEQAMHRDSPYFTTNPEYYYLGVWVALEEVDERNGALVVYDHGHLLHEPDRFALYATVYGPEDRMQPYDGRLWDVYQKAVNRQCEDRGLCKVVVPMSPGDTLIWHPHLPHGGSPIMERHRSRLSMVNHVIPINTSVSGLDVFYGQQQPPTVANYSYLDYDGRKFANHANVEFAHQDPTPANEFRL
jgi:ectoine hydroxylase-related dioxygenase (phytanoyl-CoA dioxygenase family)